MNLPQIIDRIKSELYSNNSLSEEEKWIRIFDFLDKETIELRKIWYRKGMNRAISIIEKELE